MYAVAILLNTILGGVLGAGYYGALTAPYIKAAHGGKMPKPTPINYIFAVGGNAVASTVFWRLVEFWGASSFADYAVLSGFLFAYSAAIYIPHPLFDGNDRPERWTVAAVHLGYDGLRAVLTAVVFYFLAVGAPVAA